MKALFELLSSIYIIFIQIPVLLTLVLIIIFEYLLVTLQAVSYIVRFLPEPFAVCGVVLVFLNITLKIIKR